MSTDSEQQRYEELQEEMGSRGLIGRSLEQANRRKQAEREGRDIEFLVPVRNDKIYSVGVLLLIGGLLLLLFIAWAFTLGMSTLRLGILGAFGVIAGGKEVASQKWNLSIVTSNGQVTNLGSRWLDGGWDDDEGLELIQTIERFRNPVPSPFVAAKG
ncbi:MAG: hypothetical protein IPK82_05345 [Polyangiaceae bacterium]|nr:hypothetical protein [Polyangiaceae bacterium]